jgi:hypothetical protein
MLAIVAVGDSGLASRCQDGFKPFGSYPLRVVQDLQQVRVRVRLSVPNALLTVTDALNVKPDLHWL